VAASRFHHRSLKPLLPMGQFVLQPEPQGGPGWNGRETQENDQDGRQVLGRVVENNGDYARWRAGRS
jgi:hypothetical protein